MLVGLGEPTPPDFVTKAERPRRLGHRPLDQLVAPFFFASIRGIGAGDPMFGPLPSHSQAAEGQPNGFVADQARREALGETDLDGQRDRPPARALAERPRTLVPQPPARPASPRVEDGPCGVPAGPAGRPP